MFAFRNSFLVRSSLLPLFALALAAAPATGQGSTSSDPCGDWELIPPATPSGARRAILRDVVALRSGEAWAVGDITTRVPSGSRTVTHVYHWDGQAWRVAFTPPDGHSVQAVDASGPRDVWVGGSRFVPDPTGIPVGQPYVVHFDGSSWTRMDTPISPALGTGGRIDDVEVIGPGAVWFAGMWQDPSCAANMGLAMEWDGSSFTVHPTPTTCTDPALQAYNGYELQAISAASPTDIWAVGTGAYTHPSWPVPYVLHYDGSSWSLVSAPNPGFSVWLGDVEAIASDDVWAVGYLGGTYTPLMLHWDGTAWSQVPIPSGISSLHAFGSNDVYGGGQGIYHWDGSAWSLVESFPSLSNKTVTAIDAAEPCQLVAVGSSNHRAELFAARQIGLCQPDLGFGGPGTSTLQLCGPPLSSGHTATLRIAGAPPSSSAWLLTSTSLNPTPALGGTIAPIPVQGILALSLDSTGSASLDVPGGVGPVTLYLQGVVLAGSSVEITNAIAASFLR